jgi:hypothetical protein
MGREFLALLRVMSIEMWEERYVDNTADEKKRWKCHVDGMAQDKWQLTASNFILGRANSETKDVIDTWYQVAC